jgi:hypothetical protein
MPAGGVMILAETFDHSIFRQSLQRTFATRPDGLLEQGFNATLEVALPKVPSVDVLICLLWSTSPIIKPAAFRTRAFMRPPQDVVVAGAIGSVTSLKREGRSVAEVWCGPSCVQHRASQGGCPRPSIPAHKSRSTTAAFHGVRGPDARQTVGLLRCAQPS